MLIVGVLLGGLLLTAGGFAWLLRALFGPEVLP